jgi:hypothetical protein
MGSVWADTEEGMGPGGKGRICEKVLVSQSFKK